MTRAKKHMGRVAEQGCVLCWFLDWGNTPAEVHHIGDSAERSDWLTIPLCFEHHRGKAGFHTLGERAFNRTYKTCEMELLALTIERLS